MNRSKIAVRYSKALFESAKEHKQIDVLRKDMGFLLNICRIQDFRDVLDSPVIKNSKKLIIMTELFRDNVSDLTLRMIQLTVNNNRESYLPGIARSFMNLADDFEGITRVRLKTPVLINDNNRNKVIELIEKEMNTKAELDEEIEKELTGGYILQVGDLYVDASVRSQLRRIKKELLAK